MILYYNKINKIFNQSNLNAPSILNLNFNFIPKCFAEKTIYPYGWQLFCNYQKNSPMSGKNWPANYLI